MANTIDSNLVVTNIATKAIAPLEAALARMDRVCTLTDAVVSPRGVDIVVPRVTQTASTQEDPTDWESTGDSTVQSDTISGTHLVAVAHVSSGDIQGGTRLEWLLRPLAQSFAQALFNKVATEVTVANFGAAVLTVAPDAFTTGDLATLAGELRATDRSLVLDTTPHARVAPSLSWSGNGWRYPGFESVHEVTDLSSAETDTIGFTCTPAAIAGSIAPPVVPIGNGPGMIATQPVALSQLGVTALLCYWHTPGTRTSWMSIEAIAGFSPADTSALKIVSST